MARKRLHVIDDVLIVTGWVLLLPALLSLFGIGQSAARTVAALALVLTTSGALALGYMLRGRENRTLALWSILERALEVRVPELVASTGFTREQIQDALRLLNSRGLAYFVHDPGRDLIVDGRLKTTFLQIESCPNCGARLDARASADLSQLPTCRYCQHPVTADHLNGLKMRLIESLRAAPLPASPASTGHARFNLVVFIVLTTACAPLGFIYAVVCFARGNAVAPSPSPGT